MLPRIGVGREVGVARHGGARYGGVARHGQQVWHGTARQAGRTERHACMPLLQVWLLLVTDGTKSSINFSSGLSSSSNHDHHQHSTIITTALLPHQLVFSEIQFLTMGSLFENSFYVPNCSQYEPLSPTEPLSPSTVKEEERGETQAAEPGPPISQLHNTNSQGRITKRRSTKPRSYDSSDLLLSALKCTVGKHLRMTGYLPLSIDPGSKIDGKIMSWKEVEEWDMIMGEKRTVKFRAKEK
ncbi:hypothetical protein L249_8339 [Ophiocordyceps polyrhachis-furcata BCC 54312]|uniref:Uncharacterized protein n=1 Tax=Ophiocordyceps polyrhachis-furcata BCC 54312 TaxID=1330021 RepID=A0A367KZ96_9HYPO|nr:hypothetical protein L249_8339 [Ophiocordyceps polyrhachis-furcata BCC 54312]